MAKQDLGKLLSQSAARSTPIEIRRGKGAGLSVDEQELQNPNEPQVVWIDIDHLLDNPYQHDEDIHPDDYAALVESIKVDGFQGALNVSPAEGQEEYYFITGGGHQRRKAAREAGLSKVPVFVGASPAEKKQLGLRLARENTAQVNRSPVNLGFLYIQLIEEFGMTQEEIAAEIKRDRYHVNFAIMAARSAADIRTALREKYSPRVMTYLRRLGEEEDRAPIIEKYLADDLSVEGVRVAVEKVQEEKRKQEAQGEQAKFQGSSIGNRREAHFEKDEQRSGQEHGSYLPSNTEGQNDRKAALLDGLKKASLTVKTSAYDAGLEGQGNDLDASERLSKVQAVFSRVETYRRHIEKKRADGETVMLSDEESTLLGKIIDRCHTLLDAYGKKVI